MLSSWTLLFSVFVLLLLADSAQAYVGPGAGLELTGYFLSLLAWVVTAFSMFLLWPFYALLNRLRGRRGNVPTESVLATTGMSEGPGGASHTNR
jgi:hypothetical protein